MKKTLTLIFLVSCLSSFAGDPKDPSRFPRELTYKYFGGNWTLSGAKNQWGNGFGFSSKSAAQLAGFTNASDTILMQVNRVTERPTFRYDVADPWSDLAFLADITTTAADSNFWRKVSLSTVTLKAPMTNLSLTGNVTSAGLSVVNSILANNLSVTGATRTIGLTNTYNFYNNPVATAGDATVATGTAGALTGAYSYIITYYTLLGETSTGAGNGSATVNPVAQRVELTNIPTSSDPRVIGRKIYRNINTGDAVIKQLVTTIADNTTTTYTDNIADDSLGAYLPRINTTASVFYWNGTRCMVADDATTMIGYGSSPVNPGYANTGVGGFNFQDGAYPVRNFAGGLYALQHCTTCYEVNATGVHAGANLTTAFQISLSGFGAGQGITTGDNIVADGPYTLYDGPVTGTRLTAVGSFSQRKGRAGIGNSTLGYKTLHENLDGNYNFAGAPFAGFNQKHSFGIFLGTDAGDNTDADSVIIIGTSAGSITPQGSIVIGNQAQTPNAVDNNQLSIANTIYASNINGRGSIASNAKVGINNKTPTQALDVTGNILGAVISGTGLASSGALTVSESVTSHTYYGDGSHLTGLVVSAPISISGNINTTVLSVTQYASIGHFGITAPIQSSYALTVGTASGTTGSIYAYGEITSSGNINTGNGLITGNSTVWGSVASGGLTVTNNATIGGSLIITGNAQTASLTATSLKVGGSTALSFFEESTWTPTDGSGAGLSFTVTKATYQRVGNWVKVFLYLTFPTTISTSNIQISGLPYTSATNGRGVGTISTDYATSIPLARVNSAATSFIVLGTGNTDIRNVDFSGKFLIVSLEYPLQ